MESSHRVCAAIELDDVVVTPPQCNEKRSQAIVVREISRPRQGPRRNRVMPVPTWTVS